MAAPLYRLTLQNDDVGSSIFDDFDGWKDIQCVLERDPEFHSLVELVDTPLIFYATSKDYIINIIDTYGVDSTVNVLLEISVNEGDTYNNLFEGVLALEEAERIYEGSKVLRLVVPALPNEFWQKFKNRFDTPVEIGSTTDLDGGTRETINPFTLNLPRQDIVKQINAVVGDTSSFLSTRSLVNIGATRFNFYILMQPQNLIINEADVTEDGRYFNYTVQQGPINTGAGFIDNPVGEKFYIYKAANDGDYDITLNTDINITWAPQDSGNLTLGTVTVGYKIRVTDQYGVTKSNNIYDNNTTVAAPGINQTVTKTTNLSYSLDKGDEIYWWIEIDTNNTSSAAGPGNITTDLTVTTRSTHEITIDFTTEIPDTDCKAFMIHEAFNSITDLITGQDRSFFSGTLSNASTQIRQSGSSQNSFLALTRGLNIRGYTLTEKPFNASFKQLWEGINPLLNLGLGYDVDPSSPEVNYIEIRALEDFYVKNPHISLDDIENLIETEEPDLYIKEVEVGFKKWKSEEVGGIDDPQTKRRYATRFKTFGKAVKILSEFYMASLGIEITRRKGAKREEDWKLDDEIFAIEVAFGGSNDPSLDEDFSSVTGLNKTTDRYNLRYTPARNLIRHLNKLSAGLTKYIGSEFKFGGGEGNYDMTSTQSNSNRGDFDNNNLAENQNVAWDYFGSTPDGAQNIIFVPTIYEFECPLSYDQYQSFIDNRRRSFNISTSSGNYIEVFLLKLEYMPSLGKATFKVRKAY